MIVPLDVFKLTDDQSGVWVDCAESLPQALTVIRKNGAGKYLVFSQTTQHKQFYQMGSDGEPVLIKNLGSS